MLFFEIYLNRLSVEMFNYLTYWQYFPVFVKVWYKLCCFFSNGIYFVSNQITFLQ
jgi:hypothetical protein